MLEVTAYIKDVQKMFKVGSKNAKIFFAAVPKLHKFLNALHFSILLQGSFGKY